MSNTIRETLSSIVGDELSGVFFVRDYVEFHFDGPVVRMMGVVEVTVGDLRAELGRDDFFCSWVCRAIGRRLMAVQEADLGLLLTFESGIDVSVRPSTSGAEYAHFVSFPSRSLVIWN